jgi:hypothetical protein
MLLRSAIAILAFTTAAHAACGPPQEAFLTCQIEGGSKVLNVCYDDTTVTYTYGPEGAAELTLTEPISTIAYTPWPGVGRAIWEEVTFQNGTYSYTIHAGFDRMFGDETEADNPTPHFGGVVVERDGALVVDLDCIRGTVDAPWGEGLYSAKEALGLVWNPVAREWQ